jgi:glycosyltransferase involved in cell wall biosynthesis
MTHIGIDARLTHYRAGGTSTYIRALLAEFVQDSANRYTVVQSRKQKQPIVSGLRHVKVWTPPHHRLERIALSAELLRLRLDVLHSPDFIPPYRGARRHVITVHDLAFLLYPHQMTDESKRYYNDQIRTAVKQADHILSVSEATRQDLIDLLDLPHDKITVQYHGVEPAFKPLLDSQITPTLRDYRLNAGYFLFVGTIGPRKNIPGLLAGYARVREQFKDAPPLVIAGEVGWLADELMKAIHSAEGVIYLGGVAWQDFPALYNGARALLLPSHYEGFGLPALEAMACGVIPVVSDRSSLPEVTGGGGLLVDPDEPDSLRDALARILTADAAWLTLQREAALARAAQFTWARSAAIAREVYTKVALL